MHILKKVNKPITLKYPFVEWYNNVNRVNAQCGQDSNKLRTYRLFNFSFQQNIFCMGSLVIWGIRGHGCPTCFALCWSLRLTLGQTLLSGGGKGEGLGNWVSSCCLPDPREMTLTEAGVADSTNRGSWISSKVFQDPDWNTVWTWCL